MESLAAYVVVESPTITKRLIQTNLPPVPLTSFFVFAFFALVSPGFMSVANLIIISKHVAIFALLGIGMTFVILSGGIDLSVGSIVGLSAMIAGGLINEGIRLSRFGIIVYPTIWMG